MANKTLIELDLTTIESTLLKSTPPFCVHPLATSLALYLRGSTPEIPSLSL